MRSASRSATEACMWTRKAGMSREDIGDFGGVVVIQSAHRGLWPLWATVCGTVPVRSEVFLPAMAGRM